ncbi:MAG: hypothetical protein IT507_02205 [Burkholderiaceae bacterium]|nr:hypothetical protein [Burkholderiaceae bacterium]
MAILTLTSRKSSNAARACLLAFMMTSMAPAWAAGWDARTRLTNTVLHDQDVKVALESSLNQQFTTTFPSSRFGVYVLVDKSNASEPTRGVVYIMLGLCKRHPDGSYALPEVTYSSMLVLGNEDPNHERQQVTNRLAEQAAVFANAAIQNAGRLR